MDEQDYLPPWFRSEDQWDAESSPDRLAAYRPTDLWGWGFSLTLVTGIFAGALASSSACVIPDQCILVVSKGSKWCSSAVGAAMWPAGQKDLAQPVLFDDQPPISCHCFNSAEDEIMWAEVPAETF